MFKHLQKLLLFVALLVPWATQAQVTCSSGDPDTVTNLPAGSTASTTTSYFPGYAFYNYSYSEVIIPSSQLEDGGITEIKGLMFKPENTTSSTYYNNCTIYLANTTVSNLSSGFIQSTSDFEQVFAGSLNFTNTNWQIVEFDDSFTWDGSSNIVVAVKRDHGSYSSSTSFKAFAANATLGRYIYQDSGPYTVGSISGGSSTSTVPWYKLLGCSGGPVSCYRVRNLAASNILDDGLTLTWLDTSNSGATYTIYDMADTSVIASGLNTDTYTITGLDANTAYTFAVVADCGGGDESAFSRISVRTECAPIDELPFTYGFDDAATGTSAQFPFCWTRINDATSTYNYYPYVYASAHHTGANGLYWYMTTTTTYADNSYLVLPPIDADAYDITELSLSFWVGATSATYHPVFVVGVMNDPSDTSTFVPVDTISGITNIWTPVAVNFENYVGTGTYVAIKAFRPNASWYAYMDDIALLETSAYCAPVTHVTATTTSTSITLDWNGDANDSYLVYEIDGDTVTVVGNTYTFNDLVPNTVHEFEIAHLCEDTSDFVYFSTRTDCAPIDTLPFSMNFNNATTGSSYLFDPCWSIYNNYSTTSYYPYVSSGYLYMYLYSSSNINSMFGYAMLPELDESLATTDMEITFKAWNSSTSTYGGGVIVAVFDSVTSGMPTFDTVAIVIPTATSQAAAETFYIPIANRDLTGKRIGFFFQNQKPNITASYYYCYIDDVNLHELPNCLIPSNLTANATNADSVYVVWTDTNATSWEIALGTQGFNPDTLDEYITVSDTSYLFEEIEGGITYDVYVRADCGGGDYSLWLGPVSFTPGSFNMGVTGSSTLYVCNAVIYDDGGPTNDYSASCNYTLTLYPNDDTKRLKFWGSGNVEANYDYLRIYAGTAASGTMLAQIATQGVTLDTVTTQGGPITLIFHSDGSVFYSGFELHVMCEDLPSCRDVDDVEVVEVSASSAYITWTNAIGTTPLPNAYIVTVYDSTNSVAATLTTSDMFAMVGGLDPNTDYTVSVVPSCDESDGMSAGTTFTTAGFGCLQVDATLAFSDTIGNGTSTSNYLPSYSFYNYGLTQQIFTAAEIGHGGQINNISFMWQTVAQQRTYEIYMGHYNAATASDFVHPADLTCVYNGGAITLTANQWTTFNLTTPFNYNGTDNLVVILRDLTGSYVSGNYGYVHDASSGAARYAYQDSDPYDPATYSGGYSLSVRNNIILAGAPCAVEATCAAPLFVITGKTGTSVDLMWASGASETSWNVEHKAVDDASWTVDYANTQLTSATINNLSPNTEYRFRIYHLCGTDTFATVRTIRTDCVGESVPFSENFSSWSTGSSAPLPGCWFKGSNYSSGYPYVTTTGMGDSKSMYFYASGTTYTYLALPKMDAPIDTLVVTGFVYYSSAGYQMEVGVITDAEDYTTFHPLSSVSTVAYTWVPFEVTFVGQPEGNIAFSVGNGGSYNYLYLDNIEVNYFNPCIRPTNVTSTGVTQTTANISWTDTAATNFVVEYGPSGFTHGNGTVVSVTGTTAQLTGLLHSTMYDVYVRGICSEGDSSNWSFVYQFATACGPIDALPRVENFDTWGTGSSVHAPLCWTYGSDYSTSYPYITTTAHSGSGSMYMYDGYTAGSANKTWFALPELDPTVAAANQTQVVFWTYSPTTSYEHPVMVGVGLHSILDATVVWIDTVIPTYSVWTEHEIALDSYTDTGRYIFFATHIEGSYAYSYPYIDDLTLEMIPTCQRPNNLTASNATSNSVDLAWNDRANASQWQIEYGPIGFEQGTGTTVIANSNPFTLTGLPSSYQGEYYVRAICGASDSGVYSRTSCVFNTSQIPATIPYTYNFEDPAEWANWQTSSNVATNWYRGSAVANNSQYSMYVSVDSGATYKPYTNNAVVNTAVYRDIDFGTIDSSFTISFDARVGGTISASYDGLMVFLIDPALSTVASNSSITSPWGNVNDLYRIRTVRIDTNWNTYTASFDTIHGVKRVAFFWFNQSTSSYEALLEPAAVDNIVIDYSPCPRPVATTVNALSSTSANLSWVGPASASYEVIYRKTSQGAANNIFLPSSTNSISLTGLEPLTEYAVWVRKLCGNDTSLTSDVLLFSTEMCDAAEYIAIGDSTMSTSTSYNVPLNNYYNYTLCEIIIDSAELGDATEFSAISFYYNYATASSSKNNVDIYIMPTTDSVFASTDDMRAIDSSAVLVYSGNMNCTQGWNLYGFDSVYTWDGHSNLIVIIDDNSGDYDGSSYVFKTRNCNGNKSIDWYSDSYNPDVTNTSSYSGVKNLRTFRPEMQLISCGIACPVPGTLSATNVTYQSATVNWNSFATDFEVAVKAATEPTWPAEVSVSNATSYAVSNLLPATQYQFRVRAICDAAEELISDWAEGVFVTDSLPCFDPTNLHTTNLGYTTATLAWNADESQNQWNVQVWNSSTVPVDFAVSGNATTTVTGLTANTQYYAAVKAICGGGLTESEYSDTISFTTNTCAQVTGVTVNGITAHTAVVSWTPMGVSTYKIEYGERNFNEGGGTTVIVNNATSYTLTGLEEDFEYTVFVKAVCEEGVEGVWSDQVNFDTPEEGGVSVNTVDGAMNLSIYPNPTSNATTIAVSGVNGEVSITIVDMNGRAVMSDVMSCEGDCTKRMEVSGLAQGAYFVRVSGEGLNQVRKLVIK